MCTHVCVKENNNQSEAQGCLSTPLISTSFHSAGKVDPKNTPHVGGNQWAGGTGGRDTAGLGGKGGPYRLVGAEACGVWRVCGLHCICGC